MSRHHPSDSHPLAKLKTLFLGDFGLVIIFAIALLIVWSTVPGFGSTRNILGLLQSVVTIGIVACTMMLCLSSRDFDLSVGSNVAFAGMIVVMGANATNSVMLGIILAIIGSTLIGTINGVIIAKFKINALITTLAMMQIVRGLAMISSNGRAIGINDANFYEIALFKIQGIPLPIIIMIVFFIIFAIILNKTVFGRNTLAIGGNPDASRLAGVNVDQMRIWIFALQGFACAVAGIILASKITSGQPNAAMGLELSVISACVLGGVSLAGGRATMSGVFVGVMIMGIAENAMNLLNIQAFYQYLVRGAILLLAVLLDNLRSKTTSK